jgi:hypothetical protein
MMSAFADRCQAALAKRSKAIAEGNQDAVREAEAEIAALIKGLASGVPVLADRRAALLAEGNRKR